MKPTIISDGDERNVTAHTISGAISSLRKCPFGHSDMALVSSGSLVPARIVLTFRVGIESKDVGSRRVAMKKWTVLLAVILSAAMLAAQTTQTNSAVPSSAVPSGTVLMVRLDTTLATFSNKPG